MASDTRDYELVVLYHPDLEIDLDKALTKVDKIVSDQGGKITKTDTWGKRKLAYEIKKQEHAIYVYYEVSMPAASVAKVEGVLNITNEVLRYLVTNPVPEAEEEDDKKDKDSKSASKEDSKESSKDNKEDSDKEEKAEKVEEKEA